jgi:hypothetical protein
MAVAKILEVASRVDRNVAVVAKETRGVGNRITRVEAATPNVNRNVQGTYAGVSCSPHLFINVLTVSWHAATIGVDMIRRSLYPIPDRSLSNLKHTPQRGSCEGNFESGSPLPILPPIITPRAILTIPEQQSGLPRAEHLTNGRPATPCYGSVAIVCFSSFHSLRSHSLLPRFAAGCGKSVLWYATPSCFFHKRFTLFLSSAIIEDLKPMAGSPPILIAYYYFDFKDAAKRDLHGLLSSLLVQLGSDSDKCLHILSQLHMTCRDGSEQPGEESLAQCLKIMLGLPGQLPVYVIVDALDECPDTVGFPSARKKVLDFMKDLIGAGHGNLHLCITSRLEQDIESTLNSLGSRWVSLHREGGQREDINNYIRWFVYHTDTMRGWGDEDKELVITTLSEKAHGL